MNHIQDIIRRLQLGEGERRIARDMKISRGTVHKYHEIAKENNYLEKRRATAQRQVISRKALGPGCRHRSKSRRSSPIGKPFRIG